MGRIIKGLFGLAVVGIVAVVAYAYVADLTPPQVEVTKPVVLDGP